MTIKDQKINCLITNFFLQSYCTCTYSLCATIMQWAFSNMNFTKIGFHNKMKDDVLPKSLILYIKREIFVKFSIESFTDDV